MYKYIQCMGAIWRLAPTKYAKLIGDISLGKDVDLDNYGVRICNIYENLFDLQAAQNERSERD